MFSWHRSDADSGSSPPSVWPRVVPAVACVTVAVAVFASTLAVAAIGPASRGRGPGSSAVPAARDPVAFLRTVVRQIAANDYATAWRTLHPAQQRVAPLAEYVGCEQESPIPGRLTSMRVLRVAQERLRIPGTAAATPVKAVTLRLRIEDRALKASVVIVHTVHAVRVAHRWAWTFPPARYRLYRDDACGDATPAVAGVPT
jgi:hypothetical protein